MTSPLIRKLREEPQSLITIAYVALVLIGMINEAIYYRNFGINIFEYSEVFDFLIAPFKKIHYILLLGIAVFVAILAYSLDRLLQNKFPNWHNRLNFGIPKKSWFDLYRQSSILLTFLVMLLFYSTKTSEDVRQYMYNSDYSDIEIIFSSSPELKLAAKKIGANKNYLFLLDKQNQVRIIPTSSGKVEQIKPGQ